MKLKTLSCAGLLLVASFAMAQIERGASLLRKGALGVELRPPTEDEAKTLGAIPDLGMVVTRVVPGLTAEGWKLQPGDIIIKIGEDPVKRGVPVQSILAKHRTGQAISVDVVRGSKIQKFTTNFVEKPRQKEEGMTIVYDQVLAGKNRIRVIATHPKAPGKYPTVMLIGGIGAYSVDSNFDRMPYGDIMGAIAKAGYATIRIDKPGQGDSDGPNYSDLKFSEEREALLQGLRLAKTFEFVDKDNIAIFGHSMGGILGPEVASKEAVKGVAAMAFAIKSWFEYSLENTRRQVLLGGADPVEVEDYIKQLTSAYYYLYEKQMTPAAIIEAYPELKPIIQSFSPDLDTTSGVGIHFFQEIARSNRMEYWSKFTGEALLLYGENDFVCAEWDHQYVADFLNSKRPGSAKFVKVPKTDHFFTATTSYKDSFQRGMQPGQKKSEETVPILLPWLDKVLRGKG
jgi:uncharacterized protein